MLRLEAYERFRERLLSGELKPGQFVTQKELARLAGVPLGAAREAIQRLEHESLLKVYPQRGIQVAEATARLIRDAYGLRLVLEKDATRHFADHGDAETIDLLMEQTQAIIVRAKDEITNRVQEEAVEIDWRMHDTIIDSRGNEIISETYRINAARIRLARGLGNRLPAKRLISALTEHLAILDACRQRQADRAVEEMVRHIEHSLNLNFDPNYLG